MDRNGDGAVSFEEIQADAAQNPAFYTIRLGYEGYPDPTAAAGSAAAAAS